VTGELAGDDFATADYWARHIRAAVRFADSIRHANSAGGASRFIEVGPGGGLTSSIEESLAEADVVSVPLLRKDRPEPNSLMAGVAQAFVSGVGVDWHATLPGASFVELPTYAFERHRFWLSAGETAVDAAGLGLAASEHALLGAVVELPSSGGVVLTGRISSASQGWLADHAVGGVVIFPGSGFVELAIRAGDEVGCTVVDELMLAAPLVIPATGSVSMQVVVGGADDSGNRALSIYSRADARSGWTLHAEGVVRPGRRRVRHRSTSTGCTTGWPRADTGTVRPSRA
jgi:mycoketide-CoA synthase